MNSPAPVATGPGQADQIAILESAVRSLHAVVRDAFPGSVSGDQARRLVDLFAQGERAAASGIALFTPRVVETGAHAMTGHANAAEWLADVSGSSAAVAKERLTTARRASGDDDLRQALHKGDLSASQLRVLGDSEAAAPGSAGALLELAAAGASHQELRHAASVLGAAARDNENERARRARVHERRHLRWYQCPQGGIRGEFSCDEVQWARVFPGLEAAAKERWRAAESKDTTSFEAHQLDAFVELLAAASGAGSGDAAPAARVETLVLIDAEALRRGRAQGDEICEIEGIGPVSVAAATELLSEGGLRYLVKEGFDIRTVTRSSRVIAKCIDAALIARDRTCCAHPCGKRVGLERDHVHVDYKNGGLSELDNLVRLCPEHHALKTYGGWRIEGQPGERTWVAPARPKSAGAISRARKVATARAKGKADVTEDRNHPRRT